MTPFLLMVVTVLLVIGVVAMAHAALRGCFLATVWVCCGPMTAVVELIGVLVVAIANGISEATKG